MADQPHINKKRLADALRKSFADESQQVPTTTTPPHNDARLAEVRDRVEHQVATQVEAEYLMAEIDRLRVDHDSYHAAALSNRNLVDIQMKRADNLQAEVDRLRAELAEARIKAAAEIHEEGHRLMAHDRNATLHELLTFIERKYGRDLLAVNWSE